MVTKSKAPATTAGNDQLSNTVRNSAREIWLAGLGAFAKTQSEGTKVFDALVKEGQTIQARTSKVAKAKIDEMTGSLGKMTGMAGMSRNQTAGNLRRLEKLLEERVARTLNRVVVPINKGVQNLAKRVDILTASVQKLASGAPKKAVASKPAARKRAKRKLAK